MQSENTCSSTIIGGSYLETCSLYGTRELFGSGLRALGLFLEMGYDSHLCFHSCNGRNKAIINSKYHRDNVTIKLEDSVDVDFYYEHPFRMSNLHPRADYLYAHKRMIEASDDNILLFGMVDADFKVNGGKVVYDPQTSVMIPSFRQSGSKAEELILVLNSSEAIAMTGEMNLYKQREKLFEEEACRAVIIKQGAKGAVLFQEKDDDGLTIPVYMTPKVNSIGSGDIFTAMFAYMWFCGKSLETAAETASKAVACFVAKHKVEGIRQALKDFSYPALHYKEPGQIYLAGPFFSYTQRWLIGEFYQALKSEGVMLFSPLHDVGYGKASDVTDPDLDGLRASKVMLAVVDGLDSGTLFEVGYAVAMGKKVVAYVQNESREALQMLEGTHCDIEEDFTTAVYKACWYAAQ